jgi:hypothetical protein
MVMDGLQIALFREDVEFGRGLERGEAYARRPIGRRTGSRRSRLVRPRQRRPSTAAAIAELRQVMEQQHAAVMDEVKRLGHHQRDERESLPAMLRRITEIERVLKLTELHLPARSSRRRPLG